jgi:hypothetical protein
MFLKRPAKISSSVNSLVNFWVSKLERGSAGARGVDGMLCGRAETPAEIANVADKKEVLMISINCIKRTTVISEKRMWATSAQSERKIAGS